MGTGVPGEPHPGRSGALHRVRGEDPRPLEDPVRRRHAIGVDLEPDAPAVADHDHREPPADLHGADEPTHPPGGGTLPMIPDDESRQRRLVWVPKNEESEA